MDYDTAIRHFSGKEHRFKVTGNTCLGESLPYDTSRNDILYFDGEIINFFTWKSKTVIKLKKNKSDIIGLWFTLDEVELVYEPEQLNLFEED